MHRSPRLPRRRTRMLSAVALLGAVTGFGLPSDPVAASPTPDVAEGRHTAATDGPCTTATGVTVIIDFQELEGGSTVYCAPNSPSTGFDALQQAGISWDAAASSNGFLCRIAGRPSASGTPVEHPKKGDPASVKDVCRVPSPTTAYWSYWLAPRGGYWCYATFGAGNRTPAAGTVEGWSFVLNRSASATPPPRIAPSAPTPGVAAPPVPAKDCTVPSEGTPPSTTTPPPAGPSTTRPPTDPGPATPGTPSGPSGSTGPSDPARPKAPGSRPGRPSRNGSMDGSTSEPDGSKGSSTPTTVRDDKTTTTVPAGGATSTTDGSGAAEPGDGDPPAGVEGSGSRGITDPEEIAALDGDIDLGDDGRGKGSPVPLVAAGVVAVGLVAVGVRQQRRRRPAGPDPT